MSIRTTEQDRIMSGITNRLRLHGLTQTSAVTIALALECALSAPEFERRAGTIGGVWLREAMRELSEQPGD